MRLRLTLLSGEEAVLTLAPDTTVHELKLKAQREFGIHELVSSKGTEFFDDEFFEKERVSGDVKMLKVGLRIFFGGHSYLKL